ncbi:hypothetical protein ABIE56_003023 [Luteibacter sp. 621]|jgi:hypothetical protein|uniref:hypothetical protein n=1 Tax=Luteibacter sp. 621 TaxID=3373916 RepID=UPI003D245725
MNARRFLIATAIAMAACGSAHAADFPVNYAVPDSRLDAIRGGFDVGSLQASLGLERTVMINGVEAIRQSINIPDVAKITADQASALRALMATTIVSNNAGSAGGISTDAVANGSQAIPAITVASSNSQAALLPSSLTSVTSPSGLSPGLVVQNSLDNQAITATTKIDASVNTSQMLQNMRIDESIKDAVIQFRGN